MGSLLPNQEHFKSEPPQSPHRMPYERPLVLEDARGATSGSSLFGWIGRTDAPAGWSPRSASLKLHTSQAGADRVVGGCRHPEPDTVSGGRSRTADLHHPPRREGRAPHLPPVVDAAALRFPRHGSARTGAGSTSRYAAVLSGLDSPAASDHHIEDGRIPTPMVRVQPQAADGVSRTPVHRLSTEPHCVGPSRPSQISKSPAQRLKPATWSRKHNPEPTHYDAQTTSARSAGIPRSTETKNPRSKP